MTTTPNFGISLLEAAQAQKEITINQAFSVLDVFLKGSVLDKDLATPPGSPATGAAYIVAASPTGAWVGQAKSVAYFDQIWQFIAPRTGMRLRVSDEAAYYEYNGTNWVIDGGVASFTNLTVTNPITGSVTGNAATATKLVTARNINGIAFDGTADITVASNFSGTKIATTSGTSFTFTGIPSTARWIKLSMFGVSTTGSSNPILQIGSGSIATTGYLATSCYALSGSAVAGSRTTTGFGTSFGSATNTINGIVEFALMDAATYSWVCSHVLSTDGYDLVSMGAGAKALGGALDRIRLTTLGGSDTFDAGNINIMWG